MLKRCISLFLAVLMAFSLAMTAFAEGDGDKAVSSFCFTISARLCGKDPSENPPDGYSWPDWDNTDAEDADSVDFGEDNVWVASWDKNDPDNYVRLTEKFVAGKKYTAFVTFTANEGYCFNDSTRVLYEDHETYESAACSIVKNDGRSITVAVEITADHDWEYDIDNSIGSTCVSRGEDHYYCVSDPSHTKVEYRPADPDAHVWGEWNVLIEATKSQEGEREHSCALCGVVKKEVIPKYTYPYTKVYEPDTSWTMAATIAWRADESAMSVAEADVRPASAFVWLDKDLKVYDRDGALLSEDLESYVDATIGGMIPAFYVNDSETAAALKAWLPDSGLLDCFVVSTPENRELVKDVADLLHIRGMLDYTAAENPDREAMLDMIASTNGAHGKVIILSAEAATRENVRFIQSLASTVWVEAPSDIKSLVTLYTNGVNGVVTDDYQAAVDALELFKDDVPTLLRIPFIIGHRGDPSTYVENTMDSAKGAFEEGVDSVENDIHLSSDGKLFIYHDDAPNGIFGIVNPEDPYDPIDIETLSLELLRNTPFPWESILNCNEVQPENSRYGTLYGQDEQKEYFVPTLEEYIKEFKDTGLVHDTEIKSYNPDIIPVYKALVDQYDAWDQFFTITFNGEILDAMYQDYPELSIGALGMGAWTDVKYTDDAGRNYDQIADEDGPEAALKLLYGTIDRWNATYNNCYGVGWGREMVLAGRHRGLTTWPWTYRIGADGEYNGSQDFADDYLFGVTGLTCDYPWIASDYIVKIKSEDVTSVSAYAIPKPKAVTQSGEEKTLSGAQPVKLAPLSGNESLMIWRYKAELDVNGQNCGSYYLYSNPFVFTKKSSGGGGGQDGQGGDEKRFADVPGDAYYADAVDWACDSDITKGTDATHFSPDASCTRAQMVTFLWRAAGQPEPGISENPFVDVAEGMYYTDAVLWASENGITKGTDAAHFSPDATVNRGQSVTFLYRFAGESTDAENPFSDVAEDAWYYDAVLWASANDVTTGKTAELFAPEDDCTRAQIVTFLYRALGQE
ncbi:MAG: S-layer homology domain-containing protein [Oscillospiraceae bacterium]|nr:S-layer homology domain-containing protein [Oscillospiraceae bacterium]